MALEMTLTNGNLQWGDLKRILVKGKAFALSFNGQKVQFSDRFKWKKLRNPFWHPKLRERDCNVFLS